jgi:threonine synthase
MSATCPNCGKPVPESEMQGLCPECMLKLGVATQTAGPEEPAGGGMLSDPASVEEELPLVLVHHGKANAAGNLDGRES